MKGKAREVENHAVELSNLKSTLCVTAEISANNMDIESFKEIDF